MEIKHVKELKKISFGLLMESKAKKHKRFLTNEEFEKNKGLILSMTDLFRRLEQGKAINLNDLK